MRGVVYMSKGNEKYNLDEMVKIKQEIETLSREYQLKVKILENEVNMLKKAVDILLEHVLKHES